MHNTVMLASFNARHIATQNPGVIDMDWPALGQWTKTLVQGQ